MTSSFLRHTSCDECGSSDAGAVYEGGSFYCHKCGHHKNTSNNEEESRPVHKEDISFNGQFKDLVSRGLTEETCKFWSYTCGLHGSAPAQFAHYLNDSKEVVACKVRFADKSFKFIGSPSEAGLYGQWLWRPSNKKITITEGEIDALTVSQIQGHKWPVVSVPNGAQGALKAIKKAYNYLLGFESIVFMFDTDDPGRTAAKECAALFPPGKAKIATLPLKDANECLQAGRSDEVVKAFWDAQVYRPDGIVTAAEIKKILQQTSSVKVIPYPWKFINDKVDGIEEGTITTIVSGTGIGKSTFVRQLAYSLLQDHNIAMIMLEEGVHKTSRGLMGLFLKKRLLIQRVFDTVSQEDQDLAFENTINLGPNRVSMYNHFGSSDIENIIEKMRYFVKILDCKIIFLDHISILVSGLEGTKDERRTIDRAMTLLRMFVQETSITMFCVSHLRRPNSDIGHEEGAKTSLFQVRGSHAIAQLSDTVFGLERNQQLDTEDDDFSSSNEIRVRLLKHRTEGGGGIMGSLFFNKETGELLECEPLEF